MPSLLPIRPSSKAHELCARLTAMAYEMGPGARFPRVAELCASLEVSPTTLNGALGALELQQIIRRRRGSGIFVSDDLRAEPKVRRVALICDPAYVSSANHSPFWDLLIEGVQQRVQAELGILEMHFSRPGQWQPEKAFNEGLRAEIEGGQVHGVLTVGLMAPTIEWIEERGVPVVGFAGGSTYAVTQNGFLEMALGELARLGCKRVGVWKSIRPGIERIHQSQDTPLLTRIFQEAGLNFDPTLRQSGWQFVSEKSEFSSMGVQEQGYHIAMQTFGAPREQWPDGIYIAEDLMTSGALVALDKLGVAVGRDVLIATHSNAGSPLLIGRESKLTLIEFAPRDIVEALFDTLESLMNGQTPAQNTVQTFPHLHRASE